MAANIGDALARIEAGQTGLREACDANAKVLENHGELLRTIVERLGLILEKLYPEASEGPTLQELLAEMVVRLGDGLIIMHRIDRRTESMATNLPADVARALGATDGTNGNGHANGRIPS